MYHNIGTTIKTIASLTAFIGAIGAAFAGLILIASDERHAIIGLLVLVLGPILAWLSTTLIYGFGELIEKQTAAEKYLRFLALSNGYQDASDGASETTDKTPDSSAQTAGTDHASNAPAWDEPLDVEGRQEEKWIELLCPVCHMELTFPKNTKNADCPYCGCEITVREDQPPTSN